MNILWLSLALIAADVPAGTPVERAERDYRDGLSLRADGAAARERFQQSAQEYDLAWVEGDFSPNLARRRAQAWLLAGDLGRATLGYRQGLRRFPGDPGLQTGLNHSRTSVRIPPVAEMADALKPMASPRSQEVFRPEMIFAMVVGLNLAGWCRLLMGLPRRRYGVMVQGIALMAVSWLALSAWSTAKESQRRIWEEPVAVVTKASIARTGNNAEFPATFPQPIPAGVEGIPLEERGGWIKIRFRSDFVGWLPIEDVSVER